MRVVVDRDVTRQTIDIYYEAMPGRWFTYDARGRHLIHDVAPGDKPPLFLRLDHEFMRQLLTALDEANLPSLDVNALNHLRDTIGVRDWALKQIEKLINPPIITSEVDR